MESQVYCTDCMFFALKDDSPICLDGEDDCDLTNPDDSKSREIRPRYKNRLYFK